jgi:outer membrane protein assembly factor BamE (lipoprotein component of BamABCDE complex)
MAKYLPIILMAAISFAGCAVLYKSHSVMNQLKVGMTKAEAVAILGEPKHTSANENIEYLSYTLRDGVVREQYYVRIVNGKVNSFGRPGDFDSTKPPTVRIEKDEKASIKIEEKPVLYNELQKLNALKEQGLMTEEEFESKRKELLKKY